MKARRMLAAAITTLVLTGISAGPAGAGGFEELTLEEMGEYTATCDFDGDGVVTDYWALDREDQTGLQNTQIQTDGQGFTHVKIIVKFDHVAYGETPEGPPFLYNTATGTVNLVFDPDGTMIKFTIRGSGHVERADGTLLYEGPGNFDITLVDGEPTGFVTRGPSGPCVPGID